MRKTTVRSVFAAGLLLAGPGCVSLRRPSSGPEQEATLIAVLGADASQQEKADALRKLARVGTSDAVPAATALLADEKLSHMARYALESMPSPAAGRALRTALGTLSGRPLVGVIGSVGARRDVKATQTLAAMLKDADVEVVQAAARALGRIATLEAAEALATALPEAGKGTLLAICEGMLRCAEALYAVGEREVVTAIYDRLRSLEDAPHQLRTAALRGAVLTRGAEGVPLLIEAIGDDDFALVQAAARAAMELRGPEATTALADGLAALPAPKQILLTQVLGKRGDPAALPALSSLARKGEPAARVAAIRAMPEIRDPAAAPVLVGLLADAEEDVAQAAENALASLGGPQVDTALTGMLAQPDVNTRRVAIEVLGRRRVAAAVPALLKMAQDADESVRLAAIKVVGDLAGLAEFPALVDLLVAADDSETLRAVERALSAICSRETRVGAGDVVIRKAVYGDLPDGASTDVTAKVEAMVKSGSLKIAATNVNFGDPANGIVKRLRVEYTANGTADTATVNENQTLTITAGVTPQACVDALCAALPRAQTPPKLALLRLLRTARGPEALAAVRDSTAHADAEVKEAAISLLCSWPTVEALPEVARLAKTATDQRTKILALRGCFRLISLQEAAPAPKLAALKEALALAQRKEEKRLGLAALAVVTSPGALDLVLTYLPDADLKEEACAVAVTLAEALVQKHPSDVAKAMQMVSATTGDEKLAKRASALMTKAKQPQ